MGSGMVGIGWLLFADLGHPCHVLAKHPATLGDLVTSEPDALPGRFSIPGCQPGTGKWYRFFGPTPGFLGRFPFPLFHHAGIHCKYIPLAAHERMEKSDQQTRRVFPWSAFFSIDPTTCLGNDCLGRSSRLVHILFYTLSFFFRRHSLAPGCCLVFIVEEEDL